MEIFYICHGNSKRMTRLSLFGLIVVSHIVSESLAWSYGSKEPTNGGSCAAMPSVRPAKDRRKYVSSEVDRKLAETVPMFKDKRLAVLWENCLPNTLDTTVELTTDDAFVVTGDITAMWLRDSTNQLLPYLRFAESDAQLRLLFQGIIKRQAKSVLLDVYANAFTLDAVHRSPHSDDQTSKPAFAGTRSDAMQPGVFERKYELDSLANVLFLSARYYEATGDTTPFTDDPWVQAVRLILSTMRDQQVSTADESSPPYLFQRQAFEPTDTLSHGRGWPARRTGLIRSAFRPSDDATTFPFHVPANAYAVVALRNVSGLLEKIGESALAKEANELSKELSDAIQKYAIRLHPFTDELVFAYEIDGYGNALFIDDANLPSLLSLPLFGFVRSDDSTYVHTRKYILSTATNPFFFSGSAGSGVGGPHVGVGHIWPMSIAVRAWTATDDAEILSCLEMLVNSSACTGLMHESFQQDDAGSFTRSWFAWANSLFGDLILKIADERPHLIFNGR